MMIDKELALSSYLSTLSTLKIISLCVVGLMSGCLPGDLEGECLGELESDEPLYGVCKKHANVICFQNGELDFSEVPNHEENESSCDGIDNDCDGEVDERLFNACGVCGPRFEILCDGEDDDCDGKVDEGLLNRCGECPAPDEGDEGPLEICDGIDNDCDGEVDESVLNWCRSCGGLQEETCNLIDDDCDGEIDEGVRSSLRNNVLTLCNQQREEPPPCTPFCPVLEIAAIGEWSVKIGDERYADESPSHVVEINEPLYLASTEITIGQYRDCVDYGPCTPIEGEGGLDAFRWPNVYSGYPEYRVTWQQARTYAHWIGGELPTERQWEAAWLNYKLATWPLISYRGQITFKSLQEQVDELWNNVEERERRALLDRFTRHELIWSHYERAPNRTEIVEIEGHVLLSVPAEDQLTPSMKPQDMLGNVWEWTLDEYAEDSYSAQRQPAETVHCVGSPCTDDAEHVARGGSASDGVSALRSSNRASRFLVGRTGIRVIFKP
jgi:hypothetical protein